jgi:hypothetical protein
MEQMEVGDWCVICTNSEKAKLALASSLPIGEIL